jgi:hypothetical protein
MNKAWEKFLKTVQYAVGWQRIYFSSFRTEYMQALESTLTAGRSTTAFHHLMVNNSITFCDGETGCCTNTTEGLRHLMKEKMLACIRRKPLCNHYSEFM